MEDKDKDIRQALRALLIEGEEFKMRDEVSDEDGLRESGVMDSFDMIAFVVRVEERFSVAMRPEDLTEESFSSIASIAKLVHGKLGS